ncbi:hypothetical protein CEXT_262571 [Caerostris extrusa]|uniref:Uncharacterized protein n=1 Tax=Caerostris extrusa TaxID=172846 RepID=A0AAV4QZW6_CAEEX|nr:hypothetical protein CEXT_262571 [Caerostris extrusa]
MPDCALQRLPNNFFKALSALSSVFFLVRLIFKGLSFLSQFDCTGDFRFVKLIRNRNQALEVAEIPLHSTENLSGPNSSGPVWELEDSIGNFQNSVPEC